MEGFKVWEVDAFLGIDGVFACGDHGTYVFSTVGFGYLLNNSDRNKYEDRRCIVALFILLINL